MREISQYVQATPMILSRRSTVFGAVGLGLFCRSVPSCSESSNIPHSVGCCLFGDDADKIFSQAPATRALAKDKDKIRLESGNADLDFALAQALGTICDDFDVLPGFAFYDDNDSPNAYATNEVKLDRSDGTVLFGLNLLTELLNQPLETRDAAIVAVCAHEFGHIISFTTGIYEKLAPSPKQPFRSEQFADFMAGYFAGLQKNDNADYPSVVYAVTLYNLGGKVRGSHGTFDERGEAVSAGFDCAYSDRKKLSAAIDAGLRFAMSRPVGPG